MHIDHDRACETDSACVENAFCSDGACRGAAVVCEADPSPCRENVCDDELGCVTRDTPGACDDGDPCTDDVCTDAGCTNPNTADGASCGPGVQCAVSDVCLQGDCVQLPVPDGAACEDESVCTVDSCQAGVCVGVYQDGEPNVEEERVHLLAHNLKTDFYRVEENAFFARQGNTLWRGERGDDGWVVTEVTGPVYGMLWALDTERVIARHEGMNAVLHADENGAFVIGEPPQYLPDADRVFFVNGSIVYGCLEDVYGGDETFGYDLETDTTHPAGDWSCQSTVKFARDIQTAISPSYTETFVPGDAFFADRIEVEESCTGVTVYDLTDPTTPERGGGSALAISPSTFNLEGPCVWATDSMVGARDAEGRLTRATPPVQETNFGITQNVVEYFLLESNLPQSPGVEAHGVGERLFATVKAGEGNALWMASTQTVDTAFVEVFPQGTRFVPVAPDLIAEIDAHGDFLRFVPIGNAPLLSVAGPVGSLVREQNRLLVIGDTVIERFVASALAGLEKVTRIPSPPMNTSMYALPYSAAGSLRRASTRYVLDAQDTGYRYDTSLFSVEDGEADLLGDLKLRSTLKPNWESETGFLGPYALGGRLWFVLEGPSGEGLWLHGFDVDNLTAASAAGEEAYEDVLMQIYDGPFEVRVPATFLSPPEGVFERPLIFGYGHALGMRLPFTDGDHHVLVDTQTVSLLGSELSVDVLIDGFESAGFIAGGARIVRFGFEVIGDEERELRVRVYDFSAGVPVQQWWGTDDGYGTPHAFDGNIVALARSGELQYLDVSIDPPQTTGTVALPGYATSLVGIDGKLHIRMLDRHVRIAPACPPPLAP